MGTNDEVEACGRCAMSSAMGAATEGTGTNPFDGDRIELDEREVAAVSKHAVYASRLKQRLNDWAKSITYG
jgi:hypothetical protein